MTEQNHKDRITELVLEGVTRELDKGRSRLVSEGILDSLFAANTTSIISEMLDSVSQFQNDPDKYIAKQYGTEPVLDYTGRTRAAQRHHPAEGLMAAEVIFRVALPLIVEHEGQKPSLGSSGIAAVQALHHAIWRRFPPGAIAYVETILEKLSAANQVSRKQISRELHDRVAHGIVSALQRIELSRSDSDIVEPQSQAILRDAEAILHSVLDDVQEIAGSLRQLVGSSELEQALKKYAEDLHPPLPIVKIRSEGARTRLSAGVKEEAFSIVLEAIRNARRHAQNATLVDVTLIWTTSALRINVVNDGQGFDEDQIRSGGIGMLSMRERAEVIGASLAITSEPYWTKVALSIPLPS